MIHERDVKHRALNTEFGYPEPDGSFGIGCKSSVDQEYKRRYDEIESRFRKPYDDQLPALHRWALENSMSVYECLLMDDIWDDDLKALAKLSTMEEDWQFQPIIAKARFMVARWKEEHVVGEIQRRVKIESSHFHYAAARCRNLLGLKPWDLAAQKAIFDYGKEWKSALEFAFGSLTAA
ncbi:hypothetical protein D1F64_06305 [Breoghania sp. L-A4]|nr:hypothetical protein D1F64_06305 [Breoghania sp. L-A4]